MSAGDRPEGGDSPRPAEGPHDGLPRVGDEFMDVSRVHAAIMREKDEPAEGFEHVPTLWLAAVLALATWGGAYLGSFNFGFRADTLEGAPAVSLSARSDAPAPPLDPLVLGKRVFNSCAACHQGSGVGVPGQFPPLAQSEWVQGDEANLVRILLQGLAGPIEVKGKDYNGAMPAWATKLSDAQIAAVLTYIRASWDNGAAPVAPERVAEVRAQVGKRERAWSAAELIELRGAG